MARTLSLALIALLICSTAAFAAAKRPDLGMLKVTLMTEEIAAGSQLLIHDKVANAGKAAAKPSRVGYYLSVDTIRSKDDIRLGERSVRRLKPGKAASGSAKVTVPNAVGLFRVIACADDRQRVRESHEANNCRPVTRDLRITSAR